MTLTGDDIKRIISECVTRLMEAHGTLDDSMRALAELIVNRVKSGEDKFSLSRDELARYYPYEHVPESLNVHVKDMYWRYTGVKAAYGYETNSIKLDSTLVYFLRNMKNYETEIVKIVMHELTHFVNHFESQEDVNRMPRPMNFERTEPSKAAKRILYLFNKGELNARATEFKWEMRKRKPGEPVHGFGDYEDVTRLKSMRDLIETVKNDTQPSDDQPLSVVELLLQSRGHRKMQIDGRERMLNPSPEDFEKAKEAIVKKLTKACNDFYQKLSKIYYDEVSG